jgi:hypothetical protein
LATITLKYDKLKLWKKYLEKYPLRHETILNDPDKFILYYEDEYDLMSIGFNFGMYCNKILENENV